MLHTLRRLFGAKERETWLSLSGSTSTFLRSDGTEAAPSGTPGGGVVGYMYPFADAIDDPINDNFRGASLDTSGARFSGATAWTWENQGSATATVGDGRLWLESPSSATLQIRGIYQPVPSGNWCIRAPINFRNGESTLECCVGMYLRDSGSGNIESHGVGYSGGVLIFWDSKWTNATTFSAFRVSSNFSSSKIFIPIFFEIEYDGTNYYFRCGYWDGHSNQTTSFAKTNFLSATADGIGLFSENDQSVPNTLICTGFYRVPVSVRL